MNISRLILVCFFPANTCPTSDLRLSPDSYVSLHVLQEQTRSSPCSCSLQHFPRIVLSKPPRVSVMSGSPAAGSPQARRFCRQYLQLEGQLDYPSPSELCKDETQQYLYDRLFADGALPFPPPRRHQLNTLPELVSRIDQSIHDWDEHVSPSLAEASAWR